MTALPTKSLVRITAVALLAMGSLVACGADSDKVATEPTTTDAVGSTTVADNDTTSTTAASSTTSASLANPVTTTTTTGDGNPVTGEAVDNADKSWATTASAYRQKPGIQVRFTCPPKGSITTIWGSGPYSDDSPVCVAAVHAGLISLADGGKVVVKISGAKDSFSGSTAHGVTSDDYGAWGGSYTFVKA